MSVRRRQNWLGQQRVDAPHLKSFESAVSNDFDELLSSLVIGEGRSYVVRGFEINMPGSIGASASGLQLLVENSSILHGSSDQSGTFYTVPTGSLPEILNSTTNDIVEGSFTPNTDNYIGIEYSRAVDDTTTDQVYFWDPTTNVEITKTVPLAIVMDYKVVITTSSFASNVLPIAVVQTDSSNNVISITDRRPMLFRLGTAGDLTPNPFYSYPWSDGRVENFYTSTSSTSSPFRGGDKQITNMKEFFDTLMTEFKLIKGTPFWYSESVGGSIARLRQDTANTAFTGKGNISHDATTPGKINWSEDVFLSFIGGRLRYKVAKNETSSNVILTNNQVAYVELVRGIDIIPNLVFTNGGSVVTSVGNVNWTNDLQAGDFIKDASRGDEFYYEIQSVDSLFQVTLTEPFQEISSGPAGFDAQYAFGVYETNPIPSTDRHIKIAARGQVPFGEDYFWLLYRQDDTGSVPKVYVRMLGGQELEQGEEREISDNTSQAVLQYIGSTSESDTDPNYNTLASDVKNSTENYNSINGESLTVRVSKLTSMLADKAQDKTVQLLSDHTFITNTTSGLDQDIVFSGGSGVATVVIPSSVNNGTIGLSGTLSLAANQVAFYQIDRNATFSLADLSALTVDDIDQVPLNENTFVFAYRLADTNIYLWNNQVLLSGSSIALSVLREYVQQNKTIKLVKGGTWSWDLPSNTLANSSSAFLQISGLAENVNEISAQSIVLSADGQCAYIALKRNAGASILTVNTADIASVPQDDHTFIIARRTGNDVLVGTNSFALKDGEFLELDGALAEINRYHGQLAMSPESPTSTRIRISGSDILKLNGSKLSLEQKNLLLSFDGVVIDFETGSIYETDGITSFLGGINDFPPFPIGLNEYFYYSVSILPYVAQVNNTISGQVLVIQSSASNAVLANAPKAPFPSAGIKLGNVLVQEDGSGGILNIDYSNITQLGVGGSGGGGTGDANSFTENLKHRLVSSYYEFVTPVVFEIDEDNLTDSATATFSIVNGTYEFSAAGENIISQNLFCEEFLQSDDDSLRVELHAEWFEDDTRDDNAIYEATLDGVNYETITMVRQGLSQKFFGDKLLAIPTSGVLFDQPTDTQTTELDATNLQSIATKISATDKVAINELELRLDKVGTPLGSYIVSIVADNANSPTGEILYSKIALVSTLSAGVNILTFSDFRKVLPKDTDVWVVVETDATYKSSFVTTVDSIGVRSTTAGSDLVFDGAWIASTNAIRYEVSGHVYDLRVRITSSASDKELKALGIFYNESVGSVVTGYQNIQKFRFSGDADQTVFTVTGFLPHPDFLKIYDVTSAQVYRYPAFRVSGHDIIFDAGTFLVPGETIELIFDQSEGTGFDFSDTNANLLASNHLGSTDPTVDKSVAGRGVFLRSPNGTLYEITVTDTGEIDVYSV